MVKQSKIPGISWMMSQHVLIFRTELTMKWNKKMSLAWIYQSIRNIESIRDGWDCVINRKIVFLVGRVSPCSSTMQSQKLYLAQTDYCILRQLHSTHIYWYTIYQLLILRFCNKKLFWLICVCVWFWFDFCDCPLYFSSHLFNGGKGRELFCWGFCWLGWYFC